MTDIVVRLRDLRNHWAPDRVAIADEAADEIQRLRHDIDQLINTNANLASEIEWLRVAVERKP